MDSYAVWIAIPSRTLLFNSFLPNTIKTIENKLNMGILSDEKKLWIINIFNCAMEYLNCTDNMDLYMPLIYMFQSLIFKLRLMVFGDNGDLKEQYLKLLTEQSGMNPTQFTGINVQNDTMKNALFEHLSNQVTAKICTYLFRQINWVR